MYNYIKGELINIFENYIVIENNEIGYEINVSSNTISNLKLKEKYKFYLYYHVKEDSQKFFGFLDQEEKQMFLALISVNGIGPLTAINILSSISYKRLFEAITYQDIKTISQAKGIGKKTAERIVLELKGKITINIDNDFNLQNEENLKNNENNNQTIKDAQEVLIEFGYSLVDVKQAVKKASTLENTTEGIIKIALRILSGEKNV